MASVSSLITPIRFVYDKTINNMEAILPTDVGQVVYGLTVSGTTVSYKISDGRGGFSPGSFSSSGGLESVAHDATLSGSGTASDPLSVLSGGGTTVVANPGGSGLTVLSSVTIDSTNYSIPVPATPADASLSATLVGSWEADLSTAQDGYELFDSEIPLPAVDDIHLLVFKNEALGLVGHYVLTLADITTTEVTPPVYTSTANGTAGSDTNAIKFAIGQNRGANLSKTTTGNYAVGFQNNGNCTLDVYKLDVSGALVPGGGGTAFVPTQENIYAAVSAILFSGTGIRIDRSSSNSELTIVNTVEGGGGLSTVASDATLTGDGSLADPLSVVQEIIQPDPTTGILRTPTSADVGKFAREALNLRIGTPIGDPGHGPEVAYRNYITTDAPTGLNYRGTVDSYADVDSPQVNDLVFDKTHRGWYRYSTSATAWRTTNLIPNFKGGSFSSREDADLAIEAVGDSIWWSGESDVQVVTAFVAAVADRVHYNWLPPQEIQELLAKTPLGLAVQLTAGDEESTKLWSPKVLSDWLTGIIQSAVDVSGQFTITKGSITPESIRDIPASSFTEAEGVGNTYGVSTTSNKIAVADTESPGTPNGIAIYDRSPQNVISHSVTITASQLGLGGSRRLFSIALDEEGEHLYYSVFNGSNDDQQYSIRVINVTTLVRTEIQSFQRDGRYRGMDVAGDRLYYIFYTPNPLAQTLRVRDITNRTMAPRVTSEDIGLVERTFGPLNGDVEVNNGHAWIIYITNDGIPEHQYIYAYNIELKQSIPALRVDLYEAGFEISGLESRQRSINSFDNENFVLGIFGLSSEFLKEIGPIPTAQVVTGIVANNKIDLSQAVGKLNTDAQNLDSDLTLSEKNIVKTRLGIRDLIDEGIPKVGRLPAVTPTSPFLVDLTHDYTEGARDDATVAPGFSTAISGYSDGRLFSAIGTINKRSPLTYILVVGANNSYHIDSFASSNESWLDEFDRVAIQGSNYNLGVKFLENGVYVRRVLNSPTILNAASFTFNPLRPDGTLYFTTAETTRHIAGLYEKSNDEYRKLIFEGLNHVDGIGAPTEPPTRAAQSYVDDLGRLWVSGDTTVQTTIPPSIESSIWNNSFYNITAGLLSDLSNGQFAVVYNTASFIQNQDGTFVSPSWLNMWSFITTEVTNTAETRNIRDNTVFLGTYHTVEAAAEARAQHTDLGKTYFYIKRNSSPPHHLREITSFEEGVTINTDHYFWRGPFLISEDVLGLIKVSQADGGERVNEDLTIGEETFYLGINRRPGQTPYGSINNTNFENLGYTYAGIAKTGSEIYIFMSTARWNYPKIISFNEVDLEVPSGITPIIQGTETFILFNTSSFSSISNFVTHFGIASGDVVAFNIQRSDGEFIFETTPTARQLTFGDEFYKLPDPTDVVDLLPDTTHEKDKLFYARDNHTSDHVRNDSILTIGALADGWFGWATGNGHYFSVGGGGVGTDPINDSVYEMAWKNTSGSQCQLRFSSKKNKKSIGDILALSFPDVTFAFAGSSTSTHTATKYYVYTFNAQFPTKYLTVGNTVPIQTQFSDNTWAWAGIDVKKGFYQSENINQYSRINLLDLFLETKTQAEFDALTDKDSNKLYIVPFSKMYRGDRLLLKTNAAPPLHYIWDGPNNAKDNAYSATEPHTSGTGILARIQNVNTENYTAEANEAPANWQIDTSFSDTTTHNFFAYAMHFGTEFSNTRRIYFASVNAVEYSTQWEDFKDPIEDNIAIVTRNSSNDIRHFLLSECTRETGATEGRYLLPSDTSKYFVGTNIDVAIVDTSNTNITLP